MGLMWPVLAWAGRLTQAAKIPAQAASGAGGRRMTIRQRPGPRRSALVLDLTRRFTIFERIFADARCPGPRVAAAAPPSEIIKRTDANYAVQRALGHRAHTRLGNRRLAWDVDGSSPFTITMISSSWPRDRSLQDI